jgi:hypothetical protein
MNRLVPVVATLALGCGSGLAHDHAALSTTTAYPQLVLRSTPLGYWRLGEAAGDTVAADASGNAHDGNYGGAVTLGATGEIPGDPDTAVVFDGASGVVGLGNPAALRPTTSLSVETWIKADPTQKMFPIIVGNGQDDGIHGYNLYVQQSLGGHAAFIVREGTNPWSDCYAEGNSNVLDGTWHHLVGSYTGAAIDIVVDGVRQGVDDCKNEAIDYGMAPLAYVGRKDSVSSPDSVWYAGAIDEVAIYSPAISIATAQSHLGCNAALIGCTGACPGICCLTNAQCATPPGPCYQPSGLCSAGKCSYAPDDGKACDADGDKCTPNDRCSAGSCVADEAHRSSCVQIDCNTSACNPATGDCELTPTAGSCGGNGCYGPGTCHDGACDGAQLQTCAVGTDPCRSAVCETTSGSCVMTQARNGTVCAIADACATGSPSCYAGECKVEHKSCAGSSACVQAECDPGSGACTALTLADGTPCIPQDCAEAGTCASGECRCQAAMPMPLTKDEGGCAIAGPASPTGALGLLLLLLLRRPSRRRLHRARLR